MNAIDTCCFIGSCFVYEPWLKAGFLVTACGLIFFYLFIFYVFGLTVVKFSFCFLRIYIFLLLIRLVLSECTENPLEKSKGSNHEK